MDSVNKCVVSSDGACAVSAAYGGVGESIRGAGAWCSVGTSVGAGTGFKDGVAKTESNSGVESGVGHVMRWESGKVDPSTAVRAATPREAPRRSGGGGGGRVELPLGDELTVGEFGEVALSGYSGVGEWVLDVAG